MRTSLLLAAALFSFGVMPVLAQPTPGPAMRPGVPQRAEELNFSGARQNTYRGWAQLWHFWPYVGVESLSALGSQANGLFHTSPG